MTLDELRKQQALRWVFGCALLAVLAVGLIGGYLQVNYFPADWSRCGQGLYEQRCENGKPPWVVEHTVSTMVGAALLAGVVGWVMSTAFPVDAPSPSNRLSNRNICQRCGTPRETGDRYCAQCGIELTQS